MYILSPKWDFPLFLLGPYLWHITHVNIIVSILTMRPNNQDSPKHLYLSRGPSSLLTYAKFGLSSRGKSDFGLSLAINLDPVQVLEMYTAIPLLLCTPS